METAKLTKAQQKEYAEFLQLRANMKAHLKTLSKNELIRQIFELVDLYNLERSKSASSTVAPISEPIAATSAQDKI